MNDRQRLEAIVGVVCKYLPPGGTPIKEAMSQIIALVDPLPEPVQEQMPDAMVLGYYNGHCTILPTDRARVFNTGTALYTTPPAQPAVPLTDEQADLLINGRGEHGDDDYVEPTGDGYGLTDADLVKLIRRVEAHHRIGVKP
jgi:hypothetical protein